MAYQASWMQERVAERLAELRKYKGWTVRQVADELECSHSTVSRLENAVSEPDPEMVRKLGRLYGLPEHEIVLLCSMALDAHVDKSIERFAPYVPAPYMQVARYEGQSKVIRSSQPGMVPGLLQTRNYAATIIRCGPMSHDDETAEALIDFRMQRQRRLDDPQFFRFEAVIAEAVLYCRYGDPEVLHEQLKHLRDMADNEKVTVQVVPFTRAIAMLPLEIFQFDGDAIAAFSETLWTNVVHDGAKESRRALRMFERHASQALSPDVTKSIIEERIRGTR